MTRRIRKLAVCAIVATLWLGGATATLAAVDPDADVIYVRKDCTEFSNCFTTLEAAMDWTWTVRVPTASTRLSMDIGPGDWVDQWYCIGPGSGYVSVRGAGRESTVVKGHQGSPSAEETSFKSAVYVDRCTELEFLDIGFEAEDFTVLWSGSGESMWTDVDIVNPGTGIGSVGWYDNTCSGGGSGRPLHYFFGSRIVSQGRKNAFGLVPATPYWAKCSEVWFYGGEIHWIMDETSGGEGAGLILNANADFRVFGTAIRVTVPDPTFAFGDLTGVSVSDKGGYPGEDDGPASFHMHGGIISVNSNSGSFATAIGLTVDGAEGFAHTPGTAFVVNSDFGTKRVVTTDSGNAASPFVWPTGSTPPNATSETGGVASVSGQDMFVEIDCGSGGDCSAGGTETHLMIYNASCGATNPWFDVVTGACRTLVP